MELERWARRGFGGFACAWGVALGVVGLLACSNEPPAGNGGAGAGPVGQGCAVLGQRAVCGCADGSTALTTCIAPGVFGACGCGLAQAGTSAGVDNAAGFTGDLGAAGVVATTAGAGSGTAGDGSAGAAGNGTAGGGGSAGTDAAGSGGAAGSVGDGTSCFGSWPAADPGVKGPYATTTDSNVGPGGAFTMYRPADLGMGCSTHPLITWGNGTGTTPPTYAFLLNHLASHGFIVIASNSSNVAMGTPPPMVQGVDWVLEQNADPSSMLYQRVDSAQIGATGHSQGAIATSSANTDARIGTMAPLQGGRSRSGQHGPAFLVCGGKDTTLPCSGHQTSFDAINDRPVMLGNLLAAGHSDWISASFTSATPHPYVAYTTAWMRVHLMDDQAIKPWFYGADCKICKDAAWQVSRKLM
jgi:hypothetical protein